MATDRNPDTICRHFLPYRTNPSCEAGVAYALLALDLDIRTEQLRAICMGRSPGCPHYKPYTPEEIAAEEENLTAKLQKVATARAAVLKRTNGKRGVFGKLSPCPVCEQGQLDYSVSEHNPEKTVGKCHTPNCVLWREY